MKSDHQHQASIRDACHELCLRIKTAKDDGLIIGSPRPSEILSAMLWDTDGEEMFKAIVISRAI